MLKITTKKTTFDFIELYGFYFYFNYQLYYSMLSRFELFRIKKHQQQLPNTSTIIAKQTKKLCILFIFSCSQSILTCNVSNISSFSKIESKVCIWSHDACKKKQLDNYSNCNKQYCSIVRRQIKAHTHTQIYVEYVLTRACKYDDAKINTPIMKDDATTVKPMIFAIRTELVSRLYAC